MLIDLALVVALVGTGLGAGLQATSHPRTWVADRRWMGVAVLLNTILYPLLAAGLATLLGLDADLRTGLIIVSACAGGLIGLVFTRMVGGDVERAIAAVVVLELLNLISVPFWTTVLLSSTAPVSLPDVLRTLVLLLLLPVAAGWLLQRRRPSLAPRLIRIARPISTVALIVVVLGVLRENVPVLLDTLGSGLPIAGAALLAVGIGIGWLLGGPAPAARRSMAMVTAGHATALALAVTRSTFGGHHQVEAAIAVLGLIGLVAPVLVALMLRAADRAATPAVPTGA